MMSRFLVVLSQLFLITTLIAQQTVGVFVNEPQAFDGYTLIAPTAYGNTYLIDNCGRVVKQWESNYPPGLVAYLLENGDLLRTARINGQFLGGGQGGRIERYNWNGNLIWSYNYASADFHQHHDIAYMPNGNILLLAWEKKSAAEAVQAGRNPANLNALGLWTETIVELQPSGPNSAEIVWKWDLWDHLVQDFDSLRDNFGSIANHPERIDINFESGFGGSGPDWVHLNSIYYHPGRDEIIINSRDFSECWIIDHSTTTDEAAGSTGGNAGKGGDLLYRWGNPRAYDRGTNADQKLFVQHDAHWIPPGRPDAGKILIFNNGLGRPGEDFSSVDLIQPPLDANGQYVLPLNQAYGPPAAEWTYVAPDPSSFFADRVSGAQRLPNGNTLICEGTKGKIFEITPDENIVWEYINPVVNFGPVEQGSIAGNNDLFRAYRYGPNFPAFTGKNLTPGEPIEINPLPLLCNDTITALHNEYTIPNSIQFFPNPATEHITVLTHSLQETGQLLVLNLAGSTVMEKTIELGSNDLNLSSLQAGTYILKLISPNGMPYLEKLIYTGR